MPVYNEALNVPVLYQRLMAVLQQLKLNCEIIFVNDGSMDNTFEVVHQLSVKDAQVQLLSLSRNFGHQIATCAGLDHATGKAVVIIDADLQDPPELIIDLYNKLNQGFDVVYAQREARRGESYFKLLTAKWFYRILKNITHVDIPVDTGDFRIMTRQVVQALQQMPEQQKFLRGQIAWLGFKQTSVSYTRDERNAGQSGYSYSKMLRFALDGITSFSDYPLRIASMLGFLISGLAFIMLLYALYSRLISKDYVSGWASLIVSVLFLGGIQLVCLGLIGEYIYRISTNVKNRPLYILAFNSKEKNQHEPDTSR